MFVRVGEGRARSGKSERERARTELLSDFVALLSREIIFRLRLCSFALLPTAQPLITPTHCEEDIRLMINPGSGIDLRT